MTLYKDTIFKQKVTLYEKNILSGNDLQMECRGLILKFDLFIRIGYT